MTQWLFPNGGVQLTLFSTSEIKLQWQQDPNRISSIYVFLLQPTGNSEGNCSDSYSNGKIKPTSLQQCSSCFQVPGKIPSHNTLRLIFYAFHLFTLINM